MEQSFIKRIWQKPPVLFPWVALFHVVMLCYSIWNFSSEPFPSIGWMQPFLMLLYTVSWIFACDLKRWAALVYIALTTLNLVLRFMLTSQHDLAVYTDVLFPIDILFTFFIMFYFKRFD